MKSNGPTEITGALTGDQQRAQFDTMLAAARRDARESGTPRYLLWSVNAEMWRVEATQPRGDHARTLTDEPTLVIYPDGRV